MYEGELVTVRVLLRPAIPDIRYVQLWCADNDRLECNFVDEIKRLTA